MVQEWIPVDATDELNLGQRRFTVASGVAIAKGTMLELLDARNADGVIGAGAACAGIASMDKSASDFSTSITAWTEGLFRASGSSAIVVGSALIAAGGLNEVKAGGTKVSSGATVIGYSMDAITGNPVEQITVRLQL